MARKPELGNVKLYPDRALRRAEKSYVLQFFCPIAGKRIRRSCGTRDRREARRIQRECSKRLVDGKYLDSHGAITELSAQAARPHVPAPVATPTERTWEEAADAYRSKHKRRVRRRSSKNSASQLNIARRIFEARRARQERPPGVTLRECLTLDALEYLEDQLLDGAEGKYERRSPNSVNSMLGAVMAFARYCYDHQWIERVPPLRKLDVDEVMRGRPITVEEFDQMLATVPKIVGDGPAAD